VTRDDTKTAFGRKIPRNDHCCNAIQQHGPVDKEVAATRSTHGHSNTMQAPINGKTHDGQARFAF